MIITVFKIIEGLSDWKEEICNPHNFTIFIEMKAEVLLKNISILLIPWNQNIQLVRES